MNVKIKGGKAIAVNTDTTSGFTVPFIFGYLPKARKNVYIKISPCGYLKYNGKN